MSIRVRVLTILTLMILAVAGLGDSRGASADGCVPHPEFGVTCPPTYTGSVGYPNGQPVYALGWVGHIYPDPLGVLASPKGGPATGWAAIGEDVDRAFCLYLRSEGIACGAGGW